MLPQTLHIATILFYINAVFGVLFGLAFSPIGLVLVIGFALSGLGLANSLKWGYKLAVVMAFLGLLPSLLYVASEGIGALFDGLFLFNLIFPVALVALVVHPMSRDHQRVWFE